MDIKLQQIEEQIYQKSDFFHPDREFVDLASKEKETNIKNKEFAKFINLLDSLSKDAIERWCESEIEKQFAYALFFLATRNGIFVSFLPCAAYQEMFISDSLPKEREPLRDYYAKSELLVVPNFKLLTPTNKRVRIDFLVRYKANRKRSHQFLVVECDSFQFHSSQKHLISDKQRERSIAEIGLPILRFAGGEIYKNSFRSANELLEFCFKDYGKK